MLPLVAQGSEGRANRYGVMMGGFGAGAHPTRPMNRRLRLC
nr:MFS transporter [Ensifer sp. IC4062]